MSFWKPRTKQEIIDWLYWFYDGRYSKNAIRKKDVNGWYYKLRYSGSRKVRKKLFPSMSNKTLEQSLKI